MRVGSDLVKTRMFLPSRLQAAAIAVDSNDDGESLLAQAWRQPDSEGDPASLPRFQSRTTERAACVCEM